MDELHLDGNSAAGLLQEVFPFEMSTTSSRCQGCGAIEPLGALMNYAGAGQVLRCPHCESVLMTSQISQLILSRSSVVPLVVNFQSMRRR